MTDGDIRHIVSLSGGKDSTALAIYLHEKHPHRQFEFVFSDTDKELPETYEYLDKLEAYLGQEIIRLRSDYGFDHWLHIYGGYLPSSRMRWCTKMLKIRPFEKHIREDEVRMYIGIRADEDREGYRSHKHNITSVYPFVDDGLEYADIQTILEDSGIGYPAYYQWRSRSGCFFCFYQQKKEWLGLKQHHPDLFEEARAYEKTAAEEEPRWTWNQGESLDELEHAKQRKKLQEKQRHSPPQLGSSTRLIDVLDTALDDEAPLPCSFCQI